MALARRFTTLDQTRRKVEGLFAGGDLGIRATERMYEALYLNLYTAFEAFLEDLFVGLLVQANK